MTTLRKLPKDAPIASPSTQLHSGNTPSPPYLPLARSLGKPCFEESGRGFLSEPPTQSPVYDEPPAVNSEMIDANGRNIEMTMKPTMTPIMTIMIGSSAAVSEASVASISDS